MASAQNLVFTEIMYNDPRPNTDKLEFLEIYNHDNVPVNLLGYSLNGVNFTFPDTLINPGQYFVVAVDKDTFNTVFGFQPFEWTSGSLLNTGETVKLLNASGGLVDSVKYSNTGAWNTQANGFGPSLILCDVNADNNLAASWDTSTTFVTIYYGKGLKGSPGVGESCITDLQAPMATYAKATSYTEIKVAFDEAVSNATATNINNYTLSLGITNISQPSPDTVLLTLTNPLVLGQSMYLTINNVADLAGNVMAAVQTFQVGLGGIGGNLVITEIMYNDAGAGNDQLEFIEIYNNENVPRNLMGYSFVGVNYVFPDTILTAYGVIIVA
ncbi:MAG: lamin tail domain-containing protein, partial [Bacteroidia bacterium]